MKIVVKNLSYFIPSMDLRKTALVVTVQQPSHLMLASQNITKNFIVKNLVYLEEENDSRDELVMGIIIIISPGRRPMLNIGLPIGF